MFLSGMSNIYSKKYSKFPIISYSIVKYKTNFAANLLLGDYSNIFGSNNGGIAFWSGVDNSTGYGPSDINAFFGTTSFYQITIVPYTNFSTDTQAVIEHGIVDGIGPSGNNTKLLRYNFKDTSIAAGSISNPPQSWFIFTRENIGANPPAPLQKFYYSYYVKLDPNLGIRLIYPLVGSNGSQWFTFSDLKTGGYTGNKDAGDYRFTINVNRDNDGLFWRCDGDNKADNSAGLIVVNSVDPPDTMAVAKYWRQRTASGTVRVNQWQKLEVFISRPVDKDDVTTGITWAAVTPVSTGVREVICHKVGGVQMGIQNLPFCRIMTMGHYSGGEAPIVTEFSNFELHDDLPSSRSILGINNIMYDY